MTEYSESMERDACRWISSCINKTITDYGMLANGIDFLNLLSMVYVDVDVVIVICSISRRSGNLEETRRMMTLILLDGRI